jgi:hypothetical protein
MDLKIFWQKLSQKFALNIAKALMSHAKETPKYW